MTVLSAPVSGRSSWPTRLAAALLLLASANVASTQFVAYHLHYHPALGPPLLAHIYRPWSGSAGNHSSRKALQAYFASSIPPNQRAWLWACFSCSRQAVLASAAPSGMRASTGQPIGRPAPKSLRQGYCPLPMNPGAGSMSAPGMNQSHAANNACITCVTTAPSMCSPSRRRAAARAWASSCPRFSPGLTASSSTIRRPSSGT